MKIFLSYASEHRNIAEQICLKLIAAGHDVFFDRQDLEPGRAFDMQIQEEVQRSDLFVFLLSPESIASGSYTLTEVGLAQRKWSNPEGRVLVVDLGLIQDQEVPPYLRANIHLSRKGDRAAETLFAVERMAKRLLWRRAGYRRWVKPAAMALVVLIGLWTVIQIVRRPDPQVIEDQRSYPQGLETQWSYPQVFEAQRPDPQVIEAINGVAAGGDLNEGEVLNIDRGDFDRAPKDHRQAMDGQARPTAPDLAPRKLLPLDPPAVADAQVSAICGVAAAGSIEVGGSVWIDCTPSKLVDLIEEQQAFRKSQLDRIQHIAENLGVSDSTAEELLLKVARESPPTGKTVPRLAELAAELRSGRAHQDTQLVDSLISEGPIEVARHLVVGLQPQELGDLIQEFREVDKSYIARVERLGRALNVSRSAAAKFLQILGEEKVEPEQLSAKLTQIANRHMKTVAELNALTIQDPQIAELRKLATRAVDEGDYQKAKQMLAIAQGILDKKSAATAPVTQDKASVAAVQGRVDLTQLQYEDAADWFKKAANLALDAGSRSEHAHYLDLAGDAFQDGGLFANAYFAYAEALKSREENPDESPPEAIVSTLVDMGGLYFSQSDYGNAKKRFEQALERAAESGNIDVDLLTLLEAGSHNGLANVNVVLSEYAAAEEHYAQALSLMEFLYGPDDRALLPTVTNWAWLKMNLGEYACAESLFLRARAIADSDGQALGLDAAATENNLATLYYKTGRYQEAEELWTDVRETYGAKLGETHPATLVVSQNIARALQHEGRFEQAEEAYLYALNAWRRSAKREREVDKSHLIIASLHAGLGDLYFAQDRFKEAKKKYEKAISLADSQLDDNEAAANSLLIAGYQHDLAIVHEELGEIEDSAENLEQAVETMAAKLPEHHPDLGTASNSLARVLMRLDRLDEAVPHFKRAIAVAKQTQQPLKLAARNRQLAVAYKRLGRSDEARHHLQVAQEIYANMEPEQAEKHAKIREELDRELSESARAHKH